MGFKRYSIRQKVAILAHGPGQTSQPWPMMTPMIAARLRAWFSPRVYRTGWMNPARRSSVQRGTDGPPASPFCWRLSAAALHPTLRGSHRSDHRAAHE
jgi:hypothetical protein